MNKIYILFLLHISCTTGLKENNFPSLSEEFERQVFCELLPDMIDSLWVEHKTNMQPSFGRLVDGNRVFAGRMSEEKRHETKQRFQRDLEEWIFPFDEGPLKVFMSDTLNIGHLNDYDVEYWSHLKPADFSIRPADSMPLDKSCLQVSNHFQFSPEEEGEPELNKYGIPKEVFGNLTFSRIIFDKSVCYGVIECAMHWGFNSAQGYRVYIRFQNDRWVLDGIRDAWIS